MPDATRPLLNHRQPLAAFGSGTQGSRHGDHARPIKNLCGITVAAFSGKKFFVASGFPRSGSAKYQGSHFRTWANRCVRTADTEIGVWFGRVLLSGRNTRRWKTDYWVLPGFVRIVIHWYDFSPTKINCNTMEPSGTNPLLPMQKLQVRPNLGNILVIDTVTFKIPNLGPDFAANENIRDVGNWPARTGPNKALFAFD